MYFKTILLTIITTFYFLQIKAQKDNIGISLSNGTSAINFSNSEGETIQYEGRNRGGWGINYGHINKNFLVELGINFKNVDCSYSKPGLNTHISLDVVRSTLAFSYLLLKGPIRIKMGAQAGSLHILSGYQTTNGIENNLIKENVYKTNGFSAGGQAGLIFQSGEKNQVHLSYFYNAGITNLENKKTQTSNLNSNGLQASVYFGL
jgi:hypothetical protein